MKKILLLILSVFYINLMASDNADSGYYNSGLHLLKSTLPDSVLSIIDGKPIILYMSGHYAHIWAIILEEENKYEILGGRIDPFGINKRYESVESGIIDTTAFLYANREFLTWGFDSAIIQSKRMKPLDDKIYNALSGNLSIIKNDSIETFTTKNKIVFTGPDSVNFNSKLNKLSHIMYWLAEPHIRKYTADSVYIINRHSILRNEP